MIRMIIYYRKASEYLFTQDQIRNLMSHSHLTQRNNIIRTNKLAADSLGMTVEEIEGRNTCDLFGDVAISYHEDDLRVINSGSNR